MSHLGTSLVRFWFAESNLTVRSNLTEPPGSTELELGLVRFDRSLQLLTSLAGNKKGFLFPQ